MTIEELGKWVDKKTKTVTGNMHSCFFEKIDRSSDDYNAGHFEGYLSALGQIGKLIEEE